MRSINLPNLKIISFLAATVYKNTLHTLAEAVIIACLHIYIYTLYAGQYVRTACFKQKNK